MNTQSSNGCCEKCFEGEPARMCGDNNCPCHKSSSNGCDCPTEKGLQWHTYECTFAKPSPEEWEARFDEAFPRGLCQAYEGNEGPVYAHGQEILVKKTIQEILTADRERVGIAIQGMFEDERCIMLDEFGYHSKECWDDCLKASTRNRTLDEVLALLSTEEITK